MSRKTRIPVNTNSEASLDKLPGIIQDSSIPFPHVNKIKKKRNLPGNPDPDAEVVALSPKTLLATNRYVCEICKKGFQRDQNLQLHRRGHNLPWKLKQRSNKEARKKVYVCPEPTCPHHHPSRALGDLTGIKKHYCRKHGEKKWKCGKCSKIYAVKSDWKAHNKTCGSREYRCDCGTLFTRKDSFITHRAFCDALAQERARFCGTSSSSTLTSLIFSPNPNITATDFNLPLRHHCDHFSDNWDPQNHPHIKHEEALIGQMNGTPSSTSPLCHQQQDRSLMAPIFGNLNLSTGHSPLSATALLQKAATMGSTVHTRDFLGMCGEQCTSVEFPIDHKSFLLNHVGFGCPETCTSDWI